MKRKLTLILTGFLAFSAFAVTLEEKDGSFTVRNSNYTVFFNKAKGFIAQFQTLGTKKVNPGIPNGPLFVAALTRFNVNGERDAYAATFSAYDSIVYQSRCQASGRVVSSSEKQVILEFTVTHQAGDLIKKLTFDDSCAIRMDVTFKAKSRMSRFECRVEMTMDDDTGIFYPERKRVPGVHFAYGDYVEGPSWKYAWFEKAKTGLGFVALPNKYLGGIEYRMQNRKEGWSSDYAGFSVVYTPLQIYGRNKTFEFSYLMLAGAVPEAAEKIAHEALKIGKGVSLFSAEAEKLVVRPGQDNNLNAVIWNTADSDANVTAKVIAIYDLDTEKAAAEKKYSVKAGEFKRVVIPVDLPSDAERGIALRTELYDSNGKLLDKKTDFCSVTDFAPRDTGFSIINAGMANNQNGSSEGWNLPFKRNYIGGYEYHCWAKTTFFNLAPEGDSWVPGTEADYDTPVTRKFVDDLIKNAHSKGIGVYAWITGLWDYNEAMQYPDWLQYCPDGQPNIYNGSMRVTDGSRRLSLKANPFTVERASIWAKEMVKSIDMFGWDGCRWDFTFIPSTSNDPLYAEVAVADWYDSKGVPCSKLYPDPDQTAADCLTAWRNIVEKAYPDYIYGTNYGVSEMTRRRFPKYTKKVSTRGMILFEDMLDFSVKKYSTFEKWGNELAYRTDYIRPNECAPIVGAMRGLPANSVSYHLAQYTSASAGVKWWNYAVTALGERSAERNRYLLRFARYYFGCDFLRPDKVSVSQKGREQILFKPFVRERKTEDGRDIVIPVVNMPEDNDYICVYHKTPGVRKNLVFDIGLKAGETAGAWLMTPQNPEKAVKLTVKNGTVTVPELVDACMILIQCKGGK